MDHSLDDSDVKFLEEGNAAILCLIDASFIFLFVHNFNFNILYLFLVINLV